jgi:hypothetical protein
MTAWSTDDLTVADWAERLVASKDPMSALTMARMLEIAPQ